MKFTEEEKKNRVIERAIRREWDRHEAHKNDAINRINELIQARNIEKSKFNELLAEIETDEDYYGFRMDQKIAYRARILHLAEMRIVWAKEGFLNAYGQEILLK